MKTKSAATGVTAPKNANSDCRQTNLIELEYLYHNHYSEFALLPNSKNDYGEKRYNYPIKKKIPLILLLNLFGITIISQFSRFVNIFSGNLSNYLSGGFFTFIYNLSIFLTSTAFVSTNAKIRHTSFEIYRILAKLSFRVTP